MSSKRPWMPLYIDDYLAGAAHLEAHEHGAYLLLMMRYWSKGSLPDDEDLIRRISRLSIRQWKESRETIKAFFYDGWHHKRIDDELAKAIEKSKVNSANAVKSHSNRKPVAAKPQGERTADAVPIAPANADTLHTSDKNSLSTDRDAIVGQEAEHEAHAIGTPIDPKFWPCENHTAACKFDGATTEIIQAEVAAFVANKQESGAFSNDWDASWSMWWKRWKEHQAKMAAKVAKPRAAPRVEVTGRFEPTPEEWDAQVKRFANDGASLWSRQFGPEPGMGGCRCPPEILTRHGINPATGLKIVAWRPAPAKEPV